MNRCPLRLSTLLFFVVACALPARAQETAPDSSRSEQRWGADIRAFEAADRESPPPEGAVLFVGSSSIRMWKTLAEDFPGLDVLNRGFGGSEIEDAVYFADRIILPYRPKTVVVYAGDNDLAGGKTPEQVYADYRALVDTIHAHLPEARIAFIAIKPSLARWKLAPQIAAANAMIRDHTTHDPRLVYVDVYTPMLGPDGTPRPELFLEDGLHLNAAGYDLWQDLVAPALE